MRGRELVPRRNPVWAPRAEGGPRPSRLRARYLTAVQLPQLLHDPLLQHKPLPKLLAIVFHGHFSLLVAPLLLLLLLLNLPGSGRRGQGRGVLPGGARAAARTAPGTLEEDPRAAAAASPTGRLAAARRHRHVPARAGARMPPGGGAGGARPAPLPPPARQLHARAPPAPASRAAHAWPPGSRGGREEPQQHRAARAGEGREEGGAGTAALKTPPRTLPLQPGEADLEPGEPTAGAWELRAEAGVCARRRAR